MTTQRVSIPSSSSGSAAAIASSTSWSSGLRFSGLLSVSRATASAGTVEEELARGELLAVRLATRGRRGRRPPGPTGPPRTDLLDHAVVLGLDRHLHLHRLEDDHGVAVGDLVADRDLDLPDGSGDVRFDICHRAGTISAVPAGPRRPDLLRDRRRPQRGGPDRRQLDALRAAFPGAGRSGSPTTPPTDGTADVALAPRRHAWSAAGRAHGKGGNVTAAAEAALERRDRPTSRSSSATATSAPRPRALAPLVDAVEAGECDLAVAAFRRRVGGGFGFALRLRSLGDPAVAAASTPRRRSRASGDARRVLAAVLPFADGFGMEIGMTVDAVRAGYRVEEIELDLEHRATGRTLRRLPPPRPPAARLPHGGALPAAPGAAHR